MKRAVGFGLGLLAVAAGVGLALQVLQSTPGGGVAGGQGRAPAAVDPSLPVPGHLYCGVVGQCENLNPFTTNSAAVNGYVLGFTHETLFDRDPQTGDLRGALAESWEVAPDGRAMTVTLREGVRFSDGSPLELEDVLFTYEVSQAPGIVLGSLCEGMHLVESVDVLSTAPARLRIGFDRRHFAAPARVGESWIVTDKRWFLARLAGLEAAGGAPPAPTDPDFAALLAQWTASPGPGTGPYRFELDGPTPSLREGRDLTLFRSDDAWQRRARPGTWNLAGIRLLFVADGAAYYTALVERAIDWYMCADPEQELERRPDLRDDYRVFVYDKATLGVFCVQWNTRRPHLADPAVRRALSLLFDREAICREVLGGHARPAVAFGLPDRPGYPQDLAPDPCAPREARRQLRAAGVGVDAAAGEPLEVELLVAGPDQWRQIGDLAVAAARRASVGLSLQHVTEHELIDRRGRGDWDGILVRVSFDPQGDPYDVFHSDGGLNLMGWSLPAADALLERAQVTADPAERAAIYEEFHRLVHEHQPMTMLAHPRVALLLDRHLQNAEPGPLGLWPERFWMPREHQRPGP